MIIVTSLIIMLDLFVQTYRAEFLVLGPIGYSNVLHKFQNRNSHNEFTTAHLLTYIRHVTVIL
jgi:hypothetical protein